jgi:hypothetical protein
MNVRIFQGIHVMKKLKKILLWTGITAGTLIAILLIVAAVSSWIFGRQLEKKLAAIKAAGDPVCLADLAPKPVPPEQNGAVYLRKTIDDADAAVNKIYLQTKYDEPWYVPDNRKLMKEVKDILDEYTKAYPLLQQAAACPYFDSQPDYTLNPIVFTESLIKDGLLQAGRQTSRFITARIQLFLYQGDREEALKSVVLQMQLARQYEHEPICILNYLFICSMKYMALKNANLVLQSGPISDQRIALETELSLHAPMNQLRKALKNERAMGIDGLNHQIDLPRYYLLSNSWQLGILNFYEDFMNYTSQPYSEWISITKIKSSSLNVLLNGPAILCMPALKATLTAAYRCQTSLRSIRIINALQKKAPADGDKIPTMAELGLPDEVGIDPFNGKPMIIKKLPEGWLVYSVDVNLKDDGGDLGDSILGLDYGFGPKLSKPESKEKEPDEQDEAFKEMAEKEMEKLFQKIPTKNSN